VLQFIIRRGLKAIGTLFIVVTAVFFFTRITGNPFEREFATEGLTAEMRQELEEYYGLDEPVWKQYWIYLSELLRGYAGRSVTRGARPVTAMYWQAFQMTGKLIVWCFFMGPLFGIPLGIIGAIKKDKAAGQAAMAAAFVGYAFPNFIIAIGLILVFSYTLGWLPSMGDATPAHFIMPIIALSVRRMASISRFTRSSMLDVLSQDYIRTARGKGLSERIVTFKHALRNGLIPVVTIFGTQLASLLAGSMIIETIFAWPGFGYTLIRGVQDRDYAVVQFGVLITATIVIVANLLVDIAYGVIDPRIRTEA
jgi:ABC-type dipeptide/oligopeptide/nickel transport system permease component